jgi:hypothetical protein
MLDAGVVFLVDRWSGEWSNIIIDTNHVLEYVIK